MRDRLGGDLMRAASRFAIIGMVGGLTAACSSERFASNQPFSNPFSSLSEPTGTGSIAPQPGPSPMPRGTIQSQPLPPVTAAPLAPPPPAGGMPSHPRTASGGPGWSTTGGTTVIVGPGETLSTLTSRYGVPGEAILSSNGLKAGDVTAGRRVVIPVYSLTSEQGAQRRVEASPPPVRYNAPAAPARVVASQKIEVRKPAPHTVAEAAPPKSQLRPGRAVAKASEPPHPPARVAEARPAASPAHLKPEPKTAPEPKAARTAKAEPKAKVAKAEPKVARAEPKPAERETLLPAKKVARAEPARTVPASRPEPAPQVAAASPKAEPAKAPVREPDATASIAPAAPAASSGHDFRWPARGRVISGYGGGAGNEGINIAVPEGTQVKAAGDGVVAYAGSEVKGYGNLVLIRHDNGYVSAYANNGQIEVKRGQRVTRGQSIARSGQTGNVTSPQLHFEIRKGSTPVDPMKYLASSE